MTTDFRALCAELIASWDADGCDWKPQHQARWEATVNRARAALADEPPEPIPPAALPEGYIDPEHSGDDRALLQTFYSACQAEGGTADEVILRGLRAVLARWGNHVPAPPADGEVAELVEWLREQLHACLQAPWTPGIKHFGRAAELLLQRQVVVPVSISERLPGPEDCDAEGRCWFGTPGCNVWGASWVLRKRSHQRNGITSWLPAHALPLPEVNNG